MREPKPVTRVEVSEKNRTLRFVAAGLLLLIGAIGITVGFLNFLNQDSGWQQVDVSTKERNCSESFILQYNFAGSGSQKKALNQALQEIYTDGCVKGYQLFTTDESIVGVNNMHYINHHPNEEIPVDPMLYDAFQKLQDTRWLYLGPVYAHYKNMIFNAEESSLDMLDPAVDEEAAAFVSTVAEFARDAESIRLELLPDYRVKLHVSEAYLDFAQDEEIDAFLDFAYLTNAIIIDYLAEGLQDAGLTAGYLVSADGFTRNLDSTEVFRFNIFDRVENSVYPAAAMEYRAPISIVYLKDYPSANSDVNYRGNGERVIHLFADPADGMCRTSVRNLVSYSYEQGCTDVLLKMLPGFVGAEFSLPEGVFSVWCEGSTICYQDETLTFRELYATQERTYQVALKN